MKTLIYAMQSSGASLFAYWLSQQDNCISIIDLYYDQIAPKIDHENVIMKCVVSNRYSLEQHKKNFEPDVVLLFVRNPIQNYLSLCEKSYADFGGRVKEKLKILDQCVSTQHFDHIIKYEDFIMRHDFSIGDPSFYRFDKSVEKVVEYNNQNNAWCKSNYKKKWSVGNIHVNDLDIIKHQECPHLYKMYRSPPNIV